MTDPSLSFFHQHLEKTLSHLKGEYAKLQTGRASAALIEDVPVEAYGQVQPLKAVAGISIPEARSMVVQPWDHSSLGAIEKALKVADIGVNPVNDGATIRLNFPPMTEERRKAIVKRVKELAEEARISVRQLRQDLHSSSKKDESRSEDQHRDFESALQKEVDKANDLIADIAKKKEEDVMKV